MLELFKWLITKTYIENKVNVGEKATASYGQINFQRQFSGGGGTGVNMQKKEFFVNKCFAH
jgi:hypothetical protein